MALQISMAHSQAWFQRLIKNQIRLLWCLISIYFPKCFRFGNLQMQQGRRGSAEQIGVRLLAVTSRNIWTNWVQLTAKSTWVRYSYQDAWSRLGQAVLLKYRNNSLWGRDVHRRRNSSKIRNVCWLCEAVLNNILCNWYQSDGLLREAISRTVSVLASLTHKFNPHSFIRSWTRHISPKWSWFRRVNGGLDNSELSATT